MDMTHTANRCFALLKSYGLTTGQLEDLKKRCVAVAESRGSPVIGFRHLVIAQGLPWGSTLADRKGDKVDHGA